MPRKRLFQSQVRGFEIFVLAAAVLAAAAPGCGSGSSGSESSSTSGAASTTSPPKHASARGSREAPPAPAERHGKTTEAQRRAGGGRSSFKGQKPDSKSKPGHTTANEDVSCPPAYSRSQCVADAEAAARGTPSYSVSRPRDCLRAMSRADCQALIEAELAARENDGESFRPEDCLEHRSRQECEAIFEAMNQAPK
jgi:hypothetical protein